MNYFLNKTNDQTIKDQFFKSIKMFFVLVIIYILKTEKHKYFRKTPFKNPYTPTSKPQKNDSPFWDKSFFSFGRPNYLPNEILSSSTLAVYSQTTKHCFPS
jgi:hypothetical protein